jgi:hypothetical protein
MHLRTGTLLIGAAEAAALLIALICVIVRYAQNAEPIGSLVIVVICVVIGAGALICLFLAERRQQPALLLPHLIAQALGSLALLILAIVLSVRTISTALHGSLTDSLGADIGILVVVLLATGVNTWFVLVVAKYYHFLRGHL